MPRPSTHGSYSWRTTRPCCPHLTHHDAVPLPFALSLGYCGRPDRHEVRFGVVSPTHGRPSRPLRRRHHEPQYLPDPFNGSSRLFPCFVLAQRGLKRRHLVLVLNRGLLYHKQPHRLHDGRIFGRAPRCRVAPSVQPQCHDDQRAE